MTNSHEGWRIELTEPNTSELIDTDHVATHVELLSILSKQVEANAASYRDAEAALFLAVRAAHAGGVNVHVLAERARLPLERVQSLIADR